MVILLVLLLGILAITPSLALHVVPAGNFPDRGKADTAAVYDGADHIWILGGYGDAAHNGIFRYNIETKEIVLMSQFPHVTVYDGAAYMDGNGDIYYVGGMWYDYDGYMRSRWVWKLNATSPIPSVVATFPERIANGCTYFDGGNQFWTVGGISRGNAFGVYEPNFFQANSRENTSQIIEPVLPVTRAVSACATFEDHVYVFGGYNNEETPSHLNTILKVYPMTGEVEMLNVTLPVYNHGASAVVVGDEVYMIGGGDWVTGNYADIVKFNRLTEEIVTLTPEGWTTGLDRTSSVYVPRLHRIYVFGGLQNVLGRWESEIFYVQLD